MPHNIIVIIESEGNAVSIPDQKPKHCGQLTRFPKNSLLHAIFSLKLSNIVERVIMNESPIPANMYSNMLIYLFLLNFSFAVMPIFPDILVTYVVKR